MILRRGKMQMESECKTISCIRRPDKHVPTADTVNLGFTQLTPGREPDRKSGSRFYRNAMMSLPGRTQNVRSGRYIVFFRKNLHFRCKKNGIPAM